MPDLMWIQRPGAMTGWIKSCDVFQDATIGMRGEVEETQADESCGLRVPNACSAPQCATQSVPARGREMNCNCDSSWTQFKHGRTRAAYFGTRRRRGSIIKNNKVWEMVDSVHNHALLTLATPLPRWSRKYKHGNAFIAHKHGYKTAGRSPSEIKSWFEIVFFRWNATCMYPLQEMHRPTERILWRLLCSSPCEPEISPKNNLLRLSDKRFNIM
jgi:hypothetical protein